jgi:hypothetical protein
MPSDVIARVHQLARRSKANRDLLFAWRNGTPIANDGDDDDDNDDPDWDPDDDVDNDNEGDSSEHTDDNDDDGNEDDLYLPDAIDMPVDMPIAGVLDKNENDNENNVNKNNANDNRIPNENQVVNENRLEIGNNENDKNHENDENENDENDENHENGDTKNQAEISEDDETTGVDDGQSTSDDDDTVVEKPTVETIDDETEHDDLREQMNLKYGERKHRHELRPRRPRDYDHIRAQLENVVMTQHSTKKSLKIFGEAGADAVVSEMQQLHDRSVIEPKKANMLTRDEKHKALQYLMFLKKKRCGRIKGRGCADGRKQRVYKIKEETSAPTVAVEALMLSSIIDAKERRYVVTADIPGAFMQADMDEVIHMKLKGPLAKLLRRVDPILYEKYIVTEKGKPVLYVQLMKALYETLQAALLFWDRT